MNAIVMRTRMGRRRLLAAGMMAMALLLVTVADRAAAEDEITTIYVVRHAEKADASADTQLSPAGHARAATLAHVLGDAGIDAIFVTRYARTQQTAQPLAKALGLTPQPYAANDATGDLVKQVAAHAGRAVLVVGHSNTVDDIAAAFGAPGLSDLDESQFDRLFVIHRGGDGSRLQRLRYGTATP